MKTLTTQQKSALRRVASKSYLLAKKQAIANQVRIEFEAAIFDAIDVGLTTREIAEQAGVSQPRIVQINNGRQS